MSKSKPKLELPAGAQIELRLCSDLRRNPRNARVHPPAQVKMIAASIKEFGWTFPMLVDETGGIEAGHGRLDAAEAIYAAGEKIRMASGGELPAGAVPVIVARGWSEAQKRAYVEADNRLNEIGGWDADLRREELDWLRESGFPLDAVGWNEAGLGDPVQTEWSGMPEFNQQDKTAFRSIVVHFKDQAAVDAFAKKTKQKLTANTRFIWYPEIEIETLADKRYAAKPAEAPAE